MSESRGIVMRADETPPQTVETDLAPPQGKTSIADQVVAKIAAIAAREVTGVHELATSGARGTLAGLTQRVTGGDSRAQGVNVEVGEREAAIDLGMTVDYGKNIPQVTDAVRRNIINRIQAMTGLTVKEVNIEVSDLFFQEDAVEMTERRVG